MGTPEFLEYGSYLACEPLRQTHGCNGQGAALTFRCPIFQLGCATLATRRVIDCRDHRESNCSLAMSGDNANEVIELAVLHATTYHGYQDNEELRKILRAMMKDEEEARRTTAA